MTIQSFNQLNHTRSPSIIKWHWASRLGVLGLWQPCNPPFACCTKEEHIVWGEMSRRRFHESVYDALCSLINQHRVSNGWTQEPALPSFVIVCHRLSPQPIHSHHHPPMQQCRVGTCLFLSVIGWMNTRHFIKIELCKEQKYSPLHYPVDCASLNDNTDKHLYT